MEKVEVTLDYLGETEGAWHVSNGDKDMWLPKSLVKRSEEHSSSFEMDEWLAIERDLV